MSAGGPGLCCSNGLPCALSAGKGEAIEAILAALEVVSEPFRSFANTLVDICAYAGESLASLAGGVGWASAQSHHSPSVPQARGTC